MHCDRLQHVTTPFREFARHVTALVLLATAALPALAAAPRLDIAVSKSFSSLPLYVAQEQGYFDEQGLSVGFTDCVGGHRCMALMLDGKADLATATELPVVLNSFERSDYAVIATIASTADSVKLVAGSGINTPLQLANKRVGVVVGTSSHYFLELYMLTVGVDPRKLNVVALQPEGMVAALKEGKVDAVAIWEPFALLAKQALGPNALVLTSPGAYIQTFNLMVRRPLVGVRDDDLVRLLKAIERAQKFIQDKPAAAKGILHRRLQIEPAAVESVWPGMAFRLGLDQALISTMEGEARWAMQEGHVRGGSMPNVLGLLHTAPLKAVKPVMFGPSR